MKITALIAGLGAIASAQVQRNMSMCDYYTTALLMNNTAENQQTLLTLVVNTAVIGNYTKPNVGIAVPGILAKGTYNGSNVNLLPYFTGALASSNRGGSSGVSINFLDGGGAAPLEKNMAANTTTSNQYMLLTHLYEYFAYLLGCSMYGNTTSAYMGQTSMYNVHRFMALNESDIGYFITQVGLSAASFGVEQADVEYVGKALNQLFGYRCAPAASIPANATAELQAICIDSDCPVAANATCAAYAAVVTPSAANGTNGTSTSTNGTSSGTSGTSSSSSSAATSKGGAANLTPLSYAALISLLGFGALML